MNVKHVVKVLALVFAILGSVAASRADTKAEIDDGVAAALNRFYAQDRQNHELADKAAGVLVFPRITKGGAGIAGEYGEGALLIGGHPVAYYSLGSASVGATLGIGQHSEVLLFMTRESLDAFRRSRGWTVGADAQVAVVSKGAGAQYEAATLRKPILAFVFSEKGLIGDLSIAGSKISAKTS